MCFKTVISWQDMWWIRTPVLWTVVFVSPCGIKCFCTSQIHSNSCFIGSTSVMIMSLVQGRWWRYRQEGRHARDRSSFVNEKPLDSLDQGPLWFNICTTLDTKTFPAMILATKVRYIWQEVGSSPGVSEASQAGILSQKITFLSLDLNQGVSTALSQDTD